ncbi:protein STRICTOSIDINE SYNTHASE-LIKE 10-like isoform X1 [Panicum miliaceum]|uniref:Protein STRICTOSIDINE SYNTHASE-LIKE 10-like isoform X1 n=1 Tax=Panicum miliaceum TaxID=4540 RepID=A0A3L6PHH1_PANMI|nr:protein STRICTOSIDINE SYNTHASE-LIKE 10-like isoform X1 [Panicum miliaceum]
MRTIGLAVLAAAVAAFLSLDSRRGRDGDVAVLEIRAGGGGRLELIPVDGGPYAGVSDGRVLRWLPTERRLDSCRGSQDPGREHECGRPLGLKFNSETGELYIADAYRGLRGVGPEDNVSRPLLPPEYFSGNEPNSRLLLGQ